MPSSRISINVILCERILFEQDRIYSAVRIVDVFYFKRDPDIPIEKQAVPMCVLVMGKTEPEDKAEHTVQLVVGRPDGQDTLLGQPLRAVFEAEMDEQGKALLAEGSLPSDIAGGFSIRAEIKIIPTQVGRHHLDVLLDGELVARAPFTLLELRARTSD